MGGGAEEVGVDAGLREGVHPGSREACRAAGGIKVPKWSGRCSARVEGGVFAHLGVACIVLKPSHAVGRTMDSKRVLIIVLCVAAAIIALLAPWRYVRMDPLCIFEPCQESYVATTPGYNMGGAYLAPLVVVAALLAAFAKPRLVRYGAGALTAGAALVGFLAPMGIAIIVFGEYLGPAWGATTAGVLSLLACAAALSMREEDGISAPSGTASGPLP